MVQMVQYLEHCHVLTSCSFNLRSTENEKTHVEIGNLGVEAHDKLRRKQLPANQNSSRSLGSAVSCWDLHESSSRFADMFSWLLYV